MDPLWQPLPDARINALLYESEDQRLNVGGAFVDVGIDTRNGLARYAMEGAHRLFKDGFDPSTR